MNAVPPPPLPTSHPPLHKLRPSAFTSTPPTPNAKSKVQRRVRAIVFHHPTPPLYYHHHRDRFPNVEFFPPPLSPIPKHSLAFNVAPAPQPPFRRSRTHRSVFHVCTCVWQPHPIPPLPLGARLKTCVESFLLRNKLAMLISKQDSDFSVS